MKFLHRVRQVIVQGRWLVAGFLAIALAPAILFARTLPEFLFLLIPGVGGIILGTTVLAALGIERPTDQL